MDYFNNVHLLRFRCHYRKFRVLEKIQVIQNSQEHMKTIQEGVLTNVSRLCRITKYHQLSAILLVNFLG
jgi:hypothetical protein